MNDIDFLPADYVCVRTVRSNNNWLRGLFIAVLGLMSLGWIQQQRSLHDLLAQRNRLQTQVASVMSHIDRGDGIRHQLKLVSDDLRLLDGLRTHVPPTRWLSAVVEALPAQTTITEIRAEIDEGSEATLRPDPQSPGKSDAPGNADLVKKDLEKLSKLICRRALNISVRGSAADDLEVSAFLTALHRTGLFDQVQLLFTDQHFQGSSSLRSFAIRLKTRTIQQKSNVRPSTEPVAAGHRMDLRQ